jgi:hypothetical protein
MADESSQGTRRGRVLSVDDVFAKVVGRTASEEERARLYRLRDALGLRDNDALWSIVIALEHYDSFFRAYPDKLAEKTAQSIDNARAAFAAAARHEAAHVERLLSQRVAQTSVAIARKLAEEPWRLHRITAVLAAVVAFGALCVHAGYSLALADKPFWVARSESASGVSRWLAIVLSLPAGWMLFALLLPAAMYGARQGWRLADDAVADRSDRVLGWALLVVCVMGSAACGVLLAAWT